jgi:hypothetical protein
LSFFLVNYHFGKTLESGLQNENFLLHALPLLSGGRNIRQSQNFPSLYSHVMLIPSPSNPPVNTSTLVMDAMCNKTSYLSVLSRDANPIAIKTTCTFSTPHDKRRCDVQQNPLVTRDANPIAVKTNVQHSHACHGCDVQQNFPSSHTF